jgi:hypothetical protein
MRPEKLEPRIALAGLDFGPPGSPVAASDFVVDADHAYVVSEVGHAERDTLWGTRARDFIWAPTSLSVAVPVENGTYDITYGLGDSLTARTEYVFIEGVNVDILQQGLWQWDIKTTSVEVTDGVLNVFVWSPTYAILNYLGVDGPEAPEWPALAPVTEPVFLDFGTASSPVAAGWERGRADNPWVQSDVSEVHYNWNWGEHGQDGLVGQDIHLTIPILPGTVYSLKFGVGDPTSARQTDVMVGGHRQAHWNLAEKEPGVSFCVAGGVSGAIDLVLTGDTNIRWLIVEPLGEMLNWDALPDQIIEGEAELYEEGPEGVFKVGLTAGNIDLKIGQGSQVYEANVNGVNLMANQGLAWGKWVDEVWQSTSVNTSVGESHFDYNFQHQAGQYGFPTIFSPVLAEYWDGKSYHTVVWMMPAKKVSYDDPVLFYQRLTLNEDVLEVDYVFQSFGGHVDFMSTPWAPVNREVLPNHYVGDELANDQWPGPNVLPTMDSPGYSASVGSDAEMALVYGKDATSFYRWGDVMDERLARVMTVQRHQVLEEGDTLQGRYFITFDRELAPGLVDHAFGGE